VSLYRRFGKRVLDVALAVPVLVVAAPVLAGSAAAVFVSMGRPVFFRHKRPGLHGRPFVLLKFRTMTHAKGPDGEPLPDDQRLTRVGRFLRRTSLDELPTLWNVVRGDMSLVGPRPLLMEYLPRYSAHHARRHDVRPGITGLAQVEGRHASKFSERLERDVRYVDSCSLALDLKILAKTALQVLGQESVVEEQMGRAEDIDDVGLYVVNGQRISFSRDVQEKGS
jgi:lipopolysaccharide/colanic/teichoic acid biosynthesis glycosyltransferase